MKRLEIVDPGGVTALADQTIWARRLARQLIGDSHLAEDVAQEATLAAWREGQSVRNLRAWMTTTVRRFG